MRQKQKRSEDKTAVLKIIDSLPKTERCRTFGTSPETCASKKAFRSPTGGGVGSVIEAARMRGETLYVYQCSNCNLWHLTSMSPMEVSR